MAQIVYKSLKNYKYELVQNYSFQTAIKTEKTIQIGNPCIKTFISLDPDGLLHIEAGYAWDGPSGPTIDTKTFMRGSLIHDALYQLMREEKLDRAQYREYADQLLKQICIEDGMHRFRAAYVYRSVRWFGESSAKPKGGTKEFLSAP
ncbi:hypothetical protein QMN07_15200 [Leptospira santarosai]|uniref:hypothetical protein n=1 Tax=Leptospira santarosai TaxID=28183 RepID=UPI0024AEAA5C|nr:hypothetical protein [Leptospira santarosai]MDI7218846.1 hypothetical protein [Leptospira santarosai]